MKKVITTIIILALIGFMAFKLYSNKQKNAEEVAIVAQKEAQVAVRAAQVAEENVSDLFSANGTFVAEQDLDVSSEVGGQIIKIFVKEGDFVNAGQVLAQTKADRTNVQLENAKAALETAKSDLKRFNVVNIDNLKLKITVDENQVSKLTLGQTIKIKPSAMTNEIEGKIIFIAPKADSAMKFPVEILVANKDRKLKAGMYATAQLGSDAQSSTALVVPHSAFVGSVSQNKIFKIINGKNAQGEDILQAQEITVKSGRNFGDKVEIISGLTAGEKVIVSGQINIDNGTPVKIVE